MLSEEEQAALERLRSHEADEGDYETLAYALAADYPPGWNDPVTPERLVEIGGVERKHEGDANFRWIQFANGVDVNFHNGEIDSIDIGGHSDYVELPEKLFPCNMKSARELLGRCGAIKEKSHSPGNVHGVALNSSAEADNKGE